MLPQYLAKFAAGQWISQRRIVMLCKRLAAGAAVAKYCVDVK